MGRPGFCTGHVKMHATQWRNGYKFFIMLHGTLVIYNVAFPD